MNDEDLSFYRQEIDDLDRSIVELILRRARFAHQIGQYKLSRSETIYRPDREKEVYLNIKSIAERIYQSKDYQEIPSKKRFPEKALAAIYRELMSGTVYMEGGPTVAFMGPEGSFSHLATIERFGSSVKTVAVSTIKDVFRMVSIGEEAEFGLVPVDNTTGGSVVPTMDAFLDSASIDTSLTDLSTTLDSAKPTGLQIYAEHFTRVEQHLLYHRDVELAEIKRIYTIRIGQDQCRDWLSNNLNLNQIEFIETNSTAAAARMAAERKDGAAIASSFAESLYGLVAIARNIEDSINNITRFWVIGQEQCSPTGDDRTSIIVGVDDRPGSLFSILEPFHKAGINLTRIESRITRRNYGEYNFYIDFQGHRLTPKVHKILATLQKRSSFLKILGSYPAAHPL